MNSSLTVSAEFVGSSFAVDPELNLPSHPRYPQEIVMLPYEGTGLLFEGARGTQILNGRGARGFLPRLIEKLDGTRSLDDLAACFPRLKPKQVMDALTLLYSRGLLENGPKQPELDAAHPESLAFFGRYTDATRVNANRYEAFNKLAQARVALVGNGRAVAALGDALGDMEGGQVSRPASPEDLGKADLVVALFTGEDTEAESWVQAAWQAGLPILHGCVGADRVEVGPYMIPGRSASYAAFRKLNPQVPSGAPDDLDYWAGVLALQAYNLICRIGDPRLYNVCHVHHRTPEGRVYEDRAVTRLPGSEDCGLGEYTPSQRDPESIVWQLHHAANSMPPRPLLSPRDYQMHYAATNIQVTSEVEEPWYGSVPVDLPEVTAPDAAPVWTGSERAAARPLDLAGLATLLRFTYGYTTGQTQRRIAPSAGGLGSAEIFLVVRDLEGLDPGVYRYHATGHRLELLGVVLDLSLAGALGLSESDLPPVLLVGAANTKKLQQKYNDFTFRFSALDSGVSRLYLHDIAETQGLGLVEYPEVRDRSLADVLRIPTVGQSFILTFAAGLGAEPPRLPHGEQVRAHQYVPNLVDLASGVPARTITRGPGAADRVEPPAIQSDGALGEIILARRSVRRYQDKAIPMPVAKRLAAVAEEANAALSALGGLDVEMRVWLCVNHHAGDEAGVYAFNPQTGEADRVRDGLVPADLYHVMLQHALAEAPVVMLITGNFAKAVDDFGARGYREIVARAGAIGARAMLAARAEDIGSCAWGGLTEDGWGDLLGIDRYGDCPMFGVSLGYPDG